MSPFTSHTKVFRSLSLIHRSTLSITITTSKIIRTTRFTLLRSTLKPNSRHSLILWNTRPSSIIIPTQIVHGICIPPLCSCSNSFNCGSFTTIGNIRSTKWTNIFLLGELRLNKAFFTNGLSTAFEVGGVLVQSNVHYDIHADWTFFFCHTPVLHI